MNLKLLLVDDAPEVLRVFEALLARKYDVVTAPDGPTGLALCEEQGPFAVVLSDYQMPGMNGSEFLGQVRERWPSTVSILLTGYADVEVMTEALCRARIFGFLQKLGPRDQLLATVANAVAEYDSVEQRLRQAEELGRSSEQLAQLTSSLEERLLEQTAALACLHEYVSRLNGCTSLEEISRAVVDAVRRLCPERGFQVELPDGCITPHGAGADGATETFTIEEVDGHLGSIGVCEADARGEPLTSAQRDLLQSIAASAASASHNQIRRRERNEAQQATIFALARLAEQRDNETGKHVERVSLFCKLIAEGLRAEGHHLGLIDDEWIEDLARSAPLHDIGKVGIPDNILLKQGPLTPAERAVMETHCEIGVQTLRGVIEASHSSGFLEMGLEIAYSHHEKWNGGGYPCGLSGDSIPLSARILALADVYDALTSRRPYKEPWSHAQAMALIEENAGSHFDPQVAEIFIARSSQALAIRGELVDSDDDLRRLSDRYGCEGVAGTLAG